MKNILLSFMMVLWQRFFSQAVLHKLNQTYGNEAGLKTQSQDYPTTKGDYELSPGSSKERPTANCRLRSFHSKQLGEEPRRSLSRSNWGH